MKMQKKVMALGLVTCVCLLTACGYTKTTKTQNQEALTETLEELERVLNSRSEEEASEVQESDTEAEATSKTAEDVITFEIADSEEDLEVDTYWIYDLSKKKYYIYDNDYLYLVFDYDNVTKEQLYEVVEGNSNIPEKYKQLIYEFLELALTKYPDLEMRPFYENLKTLQFVEGDEELLLSSLSFDSYGCYRKDENIIYVKGGYEYEKGTWAYQVIMHELVHCARSCRQSRENDSLIIDTSSADYSCEMLNEALTSLFTVHIFDYEELDIAYQLQSNYNQVMIDCMDNYDYSDYMQHSLSYYMAKLDEFNGNHNYAWTMIRLMEVQYDDYHDDSYELEQENYYPLYDYIADMYYRVHISEGMSETECEQVASDLIEKITYDVPEEYHLDTEEFYRYLEQMMLLNRL